MDNTVHVLLVDDNEVDVEAIRRAFRKHRIANPITVASDGLHALELLRAGEVRRPYLILLDLNMPRMTGIEFLRELRADEMLHDAIVFVLTTSKSPEDKLSSYEHHVAGYMVKSAVGEEFLDLVELLDGFWRVVEFPPGRSCHV